MARQVQVGAAVDGAEGHRTAPAGGEHAAAPSQKSLVREEKPEIRIEIIQTCHSMTDD